MDEQTTTKPVAQDDQAAEEPQPEEQTEEAVEESQEPESQNDSGTESEEEVTEQAKESTNVDFDDWASKKGLSLETENERKLAEMAYNSEKKMHQTTGKASELEKTLKTTAESSYSDDDMERIKQEMQFFKLQNSVKDFQQRYQVDEDTEAEMVKILNEQPYLWNDLEAAYGKAQLQKRDSEHEALKKEGGREALQKLAQKQLTVSPKGDATNSSSYGSKLTPENIDEEVAKMKSEEYMARRDEILAVAGYNNN